MVLEKFKIRVCQGAIRGLFMAIYFNFFGIKVLLNIKKAEERFKKMNYRLERQYSYMFFFHLAYFLNSSVGTL
jgi:hypothetical protein